MPLHEMKPGQTAPENRGAVMKLPFKKTRSKDNSALLQARRTRKYRNV